MNGLRTITLHDLDTDFFRVGDLYVLNNRTVFNEDIICGICVDVFPVHTDTDVHHEARIVYYAKDESWKNVRQELVIRPDELANEEIVILDRINADRYKGGADGRLS